MQTIVELPEFLKKASNLIREQARTRLLVTSYKVPEAFESYVGQHMVRAKVAA